MKKNIVFILIFIIALIGISFESNTDNDITKTISYNGNNLRISIDGEVSSSLPTSGTYYLVDYDCKSSNTKVEWDKDDYRLNISNGTKKGGMVCNLKFKSKPLLREMPVGSYIAYTGDSENGCASTEVNGWTSCSGKNANYVSDTDMGHCNSSNYKFNVNGWRLAYIKDGNAHLVSAGATECICSNSFGEISDTSCLDSLSNVNLFKHFEGLNNIALKYCNKDYAKNGLCVTNSEDNNTVWSMNADDFKKIMGSTLSSISCSNSASNKMCGYTNDLIDNGGYYWYATPYGGSTTSIFYWNAPDRRIGYDSSNNRFGVRPVLALDSSIVIVGGEGTYDSPYLISNNNFKINDGASYISASDDKSQVQLSLNSDGAATKMCISVNTSVCTNYVDYSDTYTLDFSSQSDGEKVVYVYYKDNSGNVIASINQSIIMDTTPPTNNSVTFVETDGIFRTLNIFSSGADYMCFSNTNYCTNWLNYATTYNWNLSPGVGPKNLYAFFKDEVGNISSVSVATTCTTNCYKYFMDAYDTSHIYLMRSDGATAMVTTSDPGVNWYSGDSQSMNVCGAYNLSASPYIWCIGNDNNAYYKTSYSATSWNSVNISSYIDVSNYNYSIYPFGTAGAFIVRNDGKTNLITIDGLTSASWSYGYATDMATCSGYSSSRVICLGADGNYYYRSNYSTTTAYTKRTFGALTNRTNTNSWIDMCGDTHTSIIEVDEVTLVNARFAYATTTNPVWYPSKIPGTGIIRTCTSGGNDTKNYCIDSDGDLYFKDYTAMDWTSSSLVIN